MHETLERICRCIVGINYDDLTTAEKNITDILIADGRLVLNEYKDVKKVVRPAVQDVVAAGEFEKSLYKDDAVLVRLPNAEYTIGATVIYVANDSIKVKLLAFSGDDLDHYQFDQQVEVPRAGFPTWSASNRIVADAKEQK